VDIDTDEVYHTDDSKPSEIIFKQSPITKIIHLHMYLHRT